MIKNISKFIDITADWNTGTLTDVVAVNDSLQLTGSWDTSSATNYFSVGSGWHADTTDEGLIDGFSDVHSIILTSGYDDIFTNGFLLSDFPAYEGAGKYLYMVFWAKWTTLPFWGGAGTWIERPSPDPNNYQKYVAKSDGQNARNEYFRIFMSISEDDGSTAYIADPKVYKETEVGIPYELQGNRLSPTIDLSPIGSVSSSAISWDSLEGLYFDGVNDYVEIPSSSSLSIVGELTFSIKLSVDNLNNDIIFFDNYANPKGNLCVIQSDGSLKIDGRNGSGTYYVLVSNAGVIEPNNVYNISFESDGTDWIIYLDGIEVARDSFGIMDWSNGINLELGARTASSSYLDGVIMNADIWDIGLTQQEIQDNLNIELIGNETGLVSYYKADEEVGTILTDYAGTNDGTIYGATWSGNVDIETSVDGQTTWQTPTNGSSIPNLTDTDTTLDVRQTLSTADITITPRLLDLYWEVISSDTDISNLNSRITSVRNSPLFKYGGLTTLEGNLNWDSRSSPIFKEGIDSILKVTFLLAKWRKELEVIRQWQTEVKPTNDWQTEAKPNNTWEG